MWKFNMHAATGWLPQTWKADLETAWQYICSQHKPNTLSWGTRKKAPHLFQAAPGSSRETEPQWPPHRNTGSQKEEPELRKITISSGKFSQTVQLIYSPVKKNIFTGLYADKYTLFYMNDIFFYVNNTRIKGSSLMSSIFLTLMDSLLGLSSDASADQQLSFRATYFTHCFTTVVGKKGFHSHSPAKNKLLLLPFELRG